MGRLARTFAACATAIALSACSAIIGIKDISLATGDDATSPADGAPGDSVDAAADSSTEAPAHVIVDTGTCDQGDANDDDNCGRCGHSCLGGTCTAGKCQPVILASGQGTVSGLAIDATHVYFSSLSGALVARVAKIGGQTQPIAGAPSVKLPKRIAVDATHVYWGNADLGDGAVLRCPLAGCSAAPESLAQPEEPTGVALANGHVYWADHNGVRIRRRPLDGGAEELVAIPPDLPVAVAVGGAFAFWVSDFSGEVFRNDPNDGGVALIGAAGGGGRDIVIDTSHVYWSAAGAVGSAGAITRAPHDGGASQFIGAARGDPQALAVDDTYVFWTSWARDGDGGVVDGGVFSCARTGCGAAAEALATGQDLPRGIAVDGDAVYWATNGSVMKLARP